MFSLHVVALYTDPLLQTGSLLGGWLGEVGQWTRTRSMYSVWYLDPAGAQRAGGVGLCC